MISKELLKGTLKTIILKLLQEKGRMYGYEITREVEKLSSGQIKVTWGGLYPVLHKMEAEKLITSVEENIGQRVRKYYSLTPSGHVTAKEKIREFLEYMRVMEGIITPAPGVNFT